MSHSALPLDSFDYRSSNATSGTSKPPLNNSFGSSATLTSERTNGDSESRPSTSHAHSPQTMDPRANVNVKARREHGRSSSKASSSSKGSDQRGVGEFALHHLFNSFVGKADFKINQCVANIPEMVARVEDICGPGVDTDFDALISALGHIARQKPKHLVDTIMFWRKAKSEEMQAAQAHWSQIKNSMPYRTVQRRNTEQSTMSQDAVQSPHGGDEPANAQSQAAHEAVIQSERKLTLSIYLICRVLIEVYQQSTLECVTPVLDNKLEDLIFQQLQVLDPDKVAASPFYYANWNIFGQLLGVMSTSNFRDVSHRFIKVLKANQEDLGPKGTTAREPEARLELLVRAMRYASINTQPEIQWVDSCDFLSSVGKLFANSHGQLIKHAFCQVLETLVFPVAASPGPQLTSPRWKDFLNTLNSRLNQMLVKPRHWSEAFPLSTLLLCASPADTFAGQWLSTVNSLQPKLKDRTTRHIALQSICRLVWTFLSRSTDTSSTMKRLEDVVKIVLPSGKKTYISSDPIFADPIIEFIRIVGFRFPEFCFKVIVFPLINADLLLSGKDIKVEQLEPDRIVIGIRAFLTMIGDLENQEKRAPHFPVFSSGGRLPISKSDSTNSSYLAQFEQIKINYASTGEKLKSPVNTSRLDSATRDYFNRFCDTLSKVTILCDHAFGGQAVLDEKFAGQTPKTPITESFSFSRRDDQTGIDHRQGFYDLLHVAVQAWPRCLSSQILFNPLINLLCTGTAHVQTNIATSSAASIKAIARQGNAQQVTMGFARFIFNFDVRYSTMSDEGLLGPGHIENTLQLYLELLKIWIEEIRQKTKNANITESPVEPTAINRSLKLDLTQISAQVDEIESHGVFFLCTQSRRVRSFAVSVLRLVTEFDKALGRPNPRIIQIMEGELSKVINPEDSSLSVAERSRLQRSKRKSGTQNTLIELCSSDVSYDATLWAKVFPNLVRLSFEQCPFTLTLSRDIVCARLLQMLGTIGSLAADGTRYPLSGGLTERPLGSARLGATPPDVVIEQWKLYLIMACTTLTNAGAQTQSQLANVQHARSRSKMAGQANDKIGSARSLFASIIPLLSAGPQTIRDAIVTALGSININLYRTLLESLQYAVTNCNEEAKMRVGTHQRTGSSPRRDRRTDRLRTEVTHVYKLTARFLREPEVLRDDWIVGNLVKYTDDMRIFLSDAEIQIDWEVQTLRRHYCGLLEEVFEGLNRTKDPSRWMSFEARKAAFILIEDWCGYSPNQSQINIREDGMKQSALNQHRESGDSHNITAAIEITKRDLRTAALSAMASLCGGPVSVMSDRSHGVSLSFDVRRIMSWIEQIFGTESDKLHVIGRRALKNLIIYNKTYPKLMEHAIDTCFVAETKKAMESYFEVIALVLREHADYQLPLWRVIGVVLFTLGTEKSTTRSKSARLLRTMEERQQRSSKLQDFDISISDKTTAVYLLAQFEISRRLAKAHSELAFFVFSQFAAHYKTVTSDHQRNMIAAILPWVQIIELSLTPNGGPTVESYMLLADLLEITTKAPTSLHNEVQALWQALATGPHAGNVQLILDFVISLCIDRREQSFVDYAKQIVVFLSSTPAGQKVVEFLLLQITPKNMVHQEKKKPMEIPPDTLGLPYIADLGDALPAGNKQSGFALGQLSLILLVDLMVSPVKLNQDQVPLLLQVCTVLWDHYTLLVQDQAREMLVHLIHELVISKIEDNTTTPSKRSIEDFVEAIRQSKSTVVWSYQESNSKDDEEDGARVPVSMTFVTNEVINLFSLAYPNIHEQWAKTTLSWATSCSVRHLACRSFQIFRCILSSLDQPMLADMLARLSNTIADEAPEVQSFSMEILTTLKTIIGALEPSDLLKYPQLFWVTCACLNTVNEREFIETLGMLDVLLSKVNLSDPAVLKILKDARPERWDGEFEGIMPLVYRGLKSANSLTKALDLISKTAAIPDSILIGDSSRLLYGILGHLPSFLRAINPIHRTLDVIEAAESLQSVAETEGFTDICRVLGAFVKSRHNASKDFLSQILAALKRSFYPTHEFRSLVFLMGLLTNKLSWFKVNTLDILCEVIPSVDMRCQDVASHGPDLISPLLRLLQTEYCPQALQVMDLIMTMNATPMDKQHLRMSMVMSGSTRSLRKEYERTQSLYGIPEDTGWSIPMPAKHSECTRNNVHAVFYTCAGQSSSESDTTATPEFEFDSENPYFPTERGDTTMSEDTRAESTEVLPLDNSILDKPIGDLQSKLDCLDDFFDDDDDDDDKYLSRYSDVTIKGYEPDPDRGANLYDQQTAPILNKSLARTASVTSLHNPYSDIRAPGVMNPGAFSSAAGNTSQLTAQLRPNFHSRSVTSPSNPLTRGENDSFSESENGEDLFSDDERSTGGRNGQPTFETMVRRSRTTGTKKVISSSGKEYRQGELLRGQSRLRSKSQAPGSPEVPKVPEAFLLPTQHAQQRPNDI